MTDVSLVHTSGGLIGDVITDSLRQPDVDGDGKFLADATTFTDRFGRAPTKTQQAADQEAAFQQCVAIWSAYADELMAGMDLTRLRERVVLKLLDLLGFDPVFQRAHLPAGDHTWAISHLGWEGTDAPPVHTVAATDLDVRDGRARSPHEELQGFLNASPLRWGILTNGRTLRLLRDFHHTRTRGYIEFDLAAIFESSSWPDFLALWRLCHASRFQHAEPDRAGGATPSSGTEPEDAEGGEDEANSTDVDADTLLERLYAKALSAGVAAGKRLQPQVRAAIRYLANGLIDSNPGLRVQLQNDPDIGRDVYRELLTVLYRTLFLLFAEQRGMLRGANPLYEETYSLTRLRTIVTEGKTEPRRMDLWEGLKTTFRSFSDESAAAALGVYPYNGFLFDQTRTPVTSAARMSNHYLTAAIEALTTVQVGKVRMHVDYRNLGVEELGAVYESLLDYTLTIADQPVYEDGHHIRPGDAYLAPLSMERADLASFYTPTDLVDLLLVKSLDPLIDQRLASAGSDPDAQVAALLDLKIIDPACGSAAILVGALDRIAYAVAKARSQPHEPLPADLAHARRETLQRCIYGAEKDPFAAELAKVALWIHCVVPDQPLTFLDHHIVCGDSLVGWPLLNVPVRIENAVFDVTGAKGALRSRLTGARNDNERFNASDGDLFGTAEVEFTLTLPEALNSPENTPADVRAKAAAYAEWLASSEYATWKQTADLWTAAPFWTNPDVNPPTTREYSAALRGQPNRALAKDAAELLADINPLHWPLAFPGIHARGGFDLVIGNPPWEQFESGEQPFFKQHAPAIAAMTSETRKRAIAALADSDPALHMRWLRYRALQGRMAHAAKSSGRFTRTSGKVNTYVLFTELAAASSNSSGLIVKSGIATDYAQSRVWKSLLTKGRVTMVLDMVNQNRSGRRVFADPAAVERFSILVLGPPRANSDLEASMLNFGVDEAANRPTRKWTLSELNRVSPTTLSILSTDDATEIDLALRLHESHGPLGFYEDTGVNLWGLQYGTLFNSSNSKEAGLLLRGTALEQQGFVLDRDKRYRHEDGRVAVPVYEGQMANRWDHRARTFEGFTGKDRYGRKPHIPWTTDQQHGDPDFEVEPRYWMHDEVAHGRVEEVAGANCTLLALRDIGAVWTNRRSLRVALMEPLPATHTLPVLIVPTDEALRAAALLNSMVLDFLVRVHMPGGHVTPWVISQCAAPSPDRLSVEVEEVARRLSVTSAGLAEYLGTSVHPWDEAERPLLDARADALVAKAYGLSWADYKTVLNHFRLLAKIETNTLGEYRSKRLRLEAFEEIGGGR